MHGGKKHCEEKAAQSEENSMVSDCPSTSIWASSISWRLVVSAGGLESFSELIVRIPASTGMAYRPEREFCSLFGMPRSAIQTGCVDFILAPGDIAHEVVYISQRSR